MKLTAGENRSMGLTGPNSFKGVLTFILPAVSLFCIDVADETCKQTLENTFYKMNSLHF